MLSQRDIELFLAGNFGSPLRAGTDLIPCRFPEDEIGGNIDSPVITLRRTDARQDEVHGYMPYGSTVDPDRSKLGCHDPCFRRIVKTAEP